MDYSATDAVLDGSVREINKRDVYDSILLSCLRKIRTASTDDQACKSLIFTVPQFVPGHIMTYDIEGAVEYLFVALRDDKEFHVRKMDDPAKLYIRWETVEAKRKRIRSTLAQVDPRPQLRPLHDPPELLRHTWAARSGHDNDDDNEVAESRAATGGRSGNVDDILKSMKNRVVKKNTKKKRG
jgi:hypothetical protein